MDIQGTIARARSPQVIERLTRTVDDLQATIEDIRAAIFQLRSRRVDQPGGFRARIQKALTDLTDDRDITTTIRFSGPMTIVDGHLAEHAEAVITEAVSNTIRHSGASRLTIETIAADELAIDIIDNGSGIPADNQRHSGLANMGYRAEQLGGNCHITTPTEGGTRIHWTAPLNP